MPCLGEIGAIVETRREGAGILFVDWSIRDYSLLSRGLYDCYDSPEFRFSDGRWHLTVWPNWMNKTGHPVRMRVGLFRSYEGPPKIFHTTVRINNFREEKMSRAKERESSNINVWHVDASCMRSEVTDENDILTIKCAIRYVVPGAARGVSAFRDVSIQTDSEIIELAAPANGRQSLDNKQDASTETDRKLEAEVLTDEKQSSEKQGCEKAMEDIGKLLMSGENSDVIVQIRDVEFKVHKNILSARCPVFSAMFRHEIVERVSNRIVIEDCEPDIFGNYLQYLYTGSVQSLAEQNAFGLYRVADKYLAGDLKLQCLKHIRDTLSVETFCDALRLALTHEESDLLQQVIDFATENIRSIVCSVEWQNFIREYPTEANEIFIKCLGPPCDTQKSK